jgi:KDO2-lipid IV(A) lauroyltransferase
VRRLTQSFTGVVEKYVRRYPDQWLWIHRRWKTRPPGEPGIY